MDVGNLMGFPKPLGLCLAVSSCIWVCPKIGGFYPQNGWDSCPSFSTQAFGGVQREDTREGGRYK